MQALANLDESHILEAFNGCAVNRSRAAFAVVALAVPAAKGEGYFFFGLLEKVLEILADDRGVVVFQEKVVSQFVCVLYCLYLRLVCFLLVVY